MPGKMLGIPTSVVVVAGGWWSVGRLVGWRTRSVSVKRKIEKKRKKNGRRNVLDPLEQKTHTHTHTKNDVG